MADAGPAQTTRTAYTPPRPQHHGPQRRAPGSAAHRRPPPAAAGHAFGRPGQRPDRLHQRAPVRGAARLAGRAADRRAHLREGADPEGGAAARGLDAAGVDVRGQSAGAEWPLTKPAESTLSFFWPWLAFGVHADFSPPFSRVCSLRALTTRSHPQPPATNSTPSRTAEKRPRTPPPPAPSPQLSTPRGARINGAGLRPDVACRPPVRVAERFAAGAAGGGRRAALLQDPCIRLALGKLAAAS